MSPGLCTENTFELAYRLYRSVSGSAVVAGISILLLVVDDVFTGPAGWISNGTP